MVSFDLEDCASWHAMPHPHTLASQAPAPIQKIIVLHSFLCGCLGLFSAQFTLWQLLINSILPIRKQTMRLCTFEIFVQNISKKLQLLTHSPAEERPDQRILQRSAVLTSEKFSLTA
jgi:hypothetical protein